jgi:hypothetical protein
LLKDEFKECDTLIDKFSRDKGLTETSFMVGCADKDFVSGAPFKDDDLGVVGEELLEAGGGMEALLFSSDALNPSE